MYVADKQRPGNLHDCLAFVLQTRPLARLLNVVASLRDFPNLGKYHFSTDVTCLTALSEQNAKSRQRCNIGSHDMVTTIRECRRHVTTPGKQMHNAASRYLYPSFCFKLGLRSISL